MREARRRIRLWWALGLALLTVGAGAPSALAGVANAGLSDATPNPLVGMVWGNYSGRYDEVFPAYRRARGEDKRLLAAIALRPRMRWFGAWYPNRAARSVIHDYIADVTRGNPTVLSQVAVFRLVPWEHKSCDRLPTRAERVSYKQWIDAFARGIGSSRVAMVLQPDLPFALCVPHHSRVPLEEVAYAAKVFDALPHTTVYIDVGAADWPSVGQAVSMLNGAGIRYTRGFALNATHYDTTQREILFGARIARRLGRAHRHFVINTADNGRGFTYQQYHGHDFDNATACHARGQPRCVTLGIPPTVAVADRRWGLSRSARAVAVREVDAYLWYGRPWLYYQNDPFQLQRTLQLARTNPFPVSNAFAVS